MDRVAFSAIMMMTNDFSRRTKGEREREREKEKEKY
jgi:hypothetical protein